MKLMTVMFLALCCTSFAFAGQPGATTFAKMAAALASPGLSDDAVTATTDGVQFCNYSDSSDALNACNKTLSVLSMMSNDEVQITGSCNDDGIYCADLYGRVTIIKQGSAK